MAQGLIIFAAAALGAGLAAIGFASAAWLLAHLLNRLAPAMQKTTVVNVAAAILPGLLLVDLVYSIIGPWSAEADVSGPDAMGIAFAGIVAVLSAIIGWFLGVRTARIAVRPNL
jgi:hypothetical protein